MRLQKFHFHKSSVVVSFLVILTCLWPLSQSNSAPPIQELQQGVVKITSTVEGKRRGGTGIIIRMEIDAAYSVTASHVIEGDQHPKVSFFSQPNRPMTAKVIGLEGGDPRGLGALLVEGTLPSNRRVLPLNPSLRVSGGETVTLVGFPRVAETS